MKKILAVILCAAMAFSIASCSTSSEPAPSIETKSGKDNDKTEATTEAISVPSDTAEGFDPEFTFSTTDRDGNTWDESSFSSNKVTMINFWEPWCGPCVSEMPDLEKLYQTYRDKGFLILGVYATPGMEEDVDAVLEQTGASYPILHYTDAFDAFETGFVPTTLFVDGEGHILHHTAEKEILKMLTDYNIEGADEKAESLYIGSMDYAGWEAIVQGGLE